MKEIEMDSVGMDGYDVVNIYWEWLLFWVYILVGWVIFLKFFYVFLI